MAEMIGALIVLLVVCAVDKACPPPKNDSTNVVKGNPKTGGGRRGRPCYRTRELPGDKRHAELIAPNGSVVLTGTTREMEIQAKLRNKEELGIEELISSMPKGRRR